MTLDLTDIKESRILVVSGDSDRRRELQRLLTSEDYAEVQTAPASKETVSRLRSLDPDLVVLDLVGPEGEAMELLSAIRSSGKDEDEPLPAVLAVASEENGDARERAREWGVRDFLRPDAGLEEVSIRVRNALEHRQLEDELERRRGWLEDRARERGEKMEQAQIGILQVLARLVEFRDYEIEQHSESVGALSARIARQIGLPEEDVEILQQAAALHDIGMVVVPDRILLKRDELDEEEKKILETHAMNGARILSRSSLPVLDLAREIALTHHEHWNGEGYPRGLMGSEIPLSGRIVAVADAFEAMTHDRPHRGAHSVEETLEEIKSERGEQFAPRVVDALLEVIEQEAATDDSSTLLHGPSPQGMGVASQET